MQTITMHITDQYRAFPFNHSIYNQNRVDSSFIRLGLSVCCQQLTISSEGMANTIHGISMGDYHYYGDDPDGARIYYNPISNQFISREPTFRNWIVS